MYLSDNQHFYFKFIAINSNLDKFSKKPPEEPKTAIATITDTLKQSHSNSSSFTVFFEDSQFAPDELKKYTDKAIFEASHNNENVKISIEIYNNEKDLSVKKSYFETINGWLDRVFPIDKYGYLTDQLGLPDRTYCYSNRNALIIFHEPISKKLRNQYIIEFNEILDTIPFYENEIPEDYEVQGIVDKYNEYLKRLNRNAHSLNIDESLANLVDSMDKKVAMAYISYDQKTITDIKSEIIPFNFVALDETYKKWDTMLNSAQEYITNKKTIQEIDNLRQPYLEKEYGPGTYVVGENILPGEYVINRNFSYGSWEINSNDDIKHEIKYLSNKDHILIPKDGIMYHITNASPTAMDGPGVYKAGFDIPAGEYQAYSKDKGTSYDFYISSDVQNPKETLLYADSIGKTFTLKKGQYLSYWKQQIVIEKIKD